MCRVRVDAQRQVALPDGAVAPEGLRAEPEVEEAQRLERDLVVDGRPVQQELRGLRWVDGGYDGRGGVMGPSTAIQIVVSRVEGSVGDCD